MHGFLRLLVQLTLPTPRHSTTMNHEANAQKPSTDGWDSSIY